MIWIIVLLLFTLALLVLGWQVLKEGRLMVTCDHCGANGDFAIQSTEEPGKKICIECAWVEYEHTHKDTSWATQFHT